MILILKNHNENIYYIHDNVAEAKNTKEEFEVLNSLFAGAHAYKDSKDLRDVKTSKIITMV